MSVHEELQEHAEHAHQPFDKRVAATMAGIAAILALVSVLAQHYNTETIVAQQLASDQWAFYQAKDIRRYVAGATTDSVASEQATLRCEEVRRRRREIPDAGRTDC